MKGISGSDYAASGLAFTCLSSFVRLTSSHGEVYLISVPAKGVFKYPIPSF